MHKALASCLLAALTVTALAGCGGSDGASKPKPKASASAGLEVVKAGDLPGAKVPGAPETTRSVDAYARFTGGGMQADPQDVEEYRANGFQAGRFTRFSLGSAAGRSGGYSAGARFASSGGASRDQRSGVATGHFARSAVPGLPHGEYTTDSGGGRVARNVYFTKGKVSYFVGFGAANADDPGKAALIAAAKRMLARLD